MNQGAQARRVGERCTPMDIRSSLGSAGGFDITRNGYDIA
jgi:hypothetical protein